MMKSGKWTLVGSLVSILMISAGMFGLANIVRSDDYITINGVMKRKGGSVPLWEAEEGLFKIVQPVSKKEVSVKEGDVRSWEDSRWRLSSKRMGEYEVLVGARSGVISDTISQIQSGPAGHDVWVRVKWRPEIDGEDGNPRWFYVPELLWVDPRFCNDFGYIPEETAEFYFTNDFGFGRARNICTDYSGQYYKWDFYRPVLDECKNPTGEYEHVWNIKFTSTWYRNEQNGLWRYRLTYSVNESEPIILSEYDTEVYIGHAVWALLGVIKGQKAPASSYLPPFTGMSGPWLLTITRSVESGGEENVGSYTFLLRRIITNARAEPNSLNADDPCPEHNYNSDDFTPYGNPLLDDPYLNAVTTIKYQLADIPDPGEYRVTIKILRERDDNVWYSVRTLDEKVSRYENIEYLREWEGVIEDDDYVGLIAPPEKYLCYIKAEDIGDTTDPYTADPYYLGGPIEVK